VLARLDHRNLNCDVPELERRVPTTENLASAIEDMLMRSWKLPARLAKVRISETAKNTFELETK
jgi:6-pyruvoyl-tetrahydropterin synthase